MAVSIDKALVDRAGAALHKAIETLNACIDKIVAVIEEDKEYDQNLVIHLAWLTHQVIQILAELKALEQAAPGGRGRERSRSLEDLFRPDGA